MTTFAWFPLTGALCGVHWLWFSGGLTLLFLLNRSVMSELINFESVSEPLGLLDSSQFGAVVLHQSQPVVIVIGRPGLCLIPTGAKKRTLHPMVKFKISSQSVISRKENSHKLRL